MTRAIALIDGEHYPPVVRAALAALGETHDVLAAVFVGGTEKIDVANGDETYGLPVVSAATPADALREAIARYEPDVTIDLSDEPVLSAAERMRLANVALERGVAYHGADFRFEPMPLEAETATPTLAVIGTGKRVGKTAVCAHIARELTASGLTVAVLAMGRGGPAVPALIRGDEVALTTADLLGFAREGMHAASDAYEDAVMSRVATVGCRRCGGGLAGGTFFSNVGEGAALCDSLGRDLLLLEGSGSAIPAVAADATVLVVGTAQGLGYVSDFFGPFRVARADAVLLTVAEVPGGADHLSAFADAVEREHPGVPVVPITFRPRPLSPIQGQRVFFATTAPPSVVPSLVAHLQHEHGCEVVATSTQLSDRSRLREDMQRHQGSYDVLLTELKAAAVDVVIAAGEAAGVPTVLCDNVPIEAGHVPLAPVIEQVARLARERHAMRST